MTTYITQSANLIAFRTFGITLYLKLLGACFWSQFVATLWKVRALLWLGLGFAITVIPTLIIGLLAMKYSTLSYGTIFAFTCGAMANPIAGSISMTG